jgi:hypothetical protein
LKASGEGRRSSRDIEKQRPTGPQARVEHDQQYEQRERHPDLLTPGGAHVNSGTVSIREIMGRHEVKAKAEVEVASQLSDMKSAQSGEVVAGLRGGQSCGVLREAVNLKR